MYKSRDIFSFFFFFTYFSKSLKKNRDLPIFVSLSRLIKLFILEREVKFLNFIFLRDTLVKTKPWVNSKLKISNSKRNREKLILLTRDTNVAEWGKKEGREGLR